MRSPLFHQQKMSSEFPYDFKADLKKEHKQHYIEAKLNQPNCSMKFTNIIPHPYLWTKQISSCLGIGFICYGENGSQIELYHSMGEHMENKQIPEILDGVIKTGCKELHFIKGIYSFLKKITDTSKLIIILANSQHDRSIMSCDIDDVVSNVNGCIKYYNSKKQSKLNPISEKSIVTCEIDGSFYLNNQGIYGSVGDIHKKSLLSLKNLIINQYRNFINKKEGESFDLPPGLASIDEQLTLSSYDYLSILNNVKVMASEKLLKTDVAVYKKIYLTIIAWDTFLNAPSKKLLNPWLEHSGFILDSDLKNEILTIEQVEPKTLSMTPTSSKSDA